MKPYERTAGEVIARVKSEDLMAEEYVASILQRQREVDESVNAYITATGEDALNAARSIDKRASKPEDTGRLAGVAIGVKDNMCTKGIRTTCASKMLQGFVPPYNATVIEKMMQEGAIIIGKTNMDEFAMGTSTETSYFGTTHNPWDLTKVPGGSSGGSAAALIAEEATLALGSDTGGSVRCPASYCSIVGLKPTYGLVSRYGLIAYANSLEQIGPMAKNVYDCALLLTVISGYDSLDSTSANLPQKNYTAYLEDDVQGLRIGVPTEFFGEGTDETVGKSVWDAIQRFEALGASFEEFSLPSLEFSLAAYYIIAMSEASSNLARYNGLRYGHRMAKDGSDWPTVYSRVRKVGFGSEVRRRIMLGTYALSAGYYNRYYLKALKIRTLIRRDFEEAFGKFNVLMGPTMPVPPFRIGEKIQDPLALYMCDVLTAPANLTGYPAISIPCGLSAGLPIGLQIVGKPFDERTLLKVAYTFEKNTNFHTKRPRM
ncbi:MAG: Asp-tRNA(Asn)/Glu-tRNA(Gln) amidotransferase subunit GatA [Candidatus Bathyarchaeota archaeon]|nr:Asp-tRNA(Asn)/Glu-tRNA(Gln) amidotransferase subunit GatA [Candidatus Bathyarchaeota archaeon]